MGPGGGEEQRGGNGERAVPWGKRAWRGDQQGARLGARVGGEWPGGAGGRGEGAGGRKALAAARPEAQCRLCPGQGTGMGTRGRGPPLFLGAGEAVAAIRPGGRHTTRAAKCPKRSQNSKTIEQQNKKRREQKHQQEGDARATARQQHPGSRNGHSTGPGAAQRGGQHQSRGSLEDSPFPTAAELLGVGAPLLGWSPWHIPLLCGCHWQPGAGMEEEGWGEGSSTRMGHHVTGDESSAEADWHKGHQSEASAAQQRGPDGHRHCRDRLWGTRGCRWDCSKHGPEPEHSSWVPDSTHGCSVSTLPCHTAALQGSRRGRLPISGQDGTT